jgi:uncharacterized membrane protein YbhN (UPF0104 family)
MARWLRRLLQLLLTIAVLGALVWAVDPAALYATARAANGGWVAVALLLLPVNLLLDGGVWRRLLGAVDGTFPRRRVAAAVLSGLALGFWTPARLGEYAGRAFAFPGADRWTVSVTVFVQRMVDMAVGVGVGLGLLLGALWTGALPATLPWIGAAALGAGTTAVLGLGVGRPGLLHRAAGLVDQWGPAVSARTAFLLHLGAADRAAVVAGTGARYLVFTGQFACLGLAFAPDAALLPLAAAVGLTFYVKYLTPSLTLLDLGIREGGAVFFFSAFGLGGAAGLNAALLLFAINVLLPAALGIPFAARLPAASSTEGGTASTKFSSILSPS